MKFQEFLKFLIQFKKKFFFFIRNRCVYINNSPLTEVVPMESADCNCAYDRHVYELRQNVFLYDCQPNGNYKPKQIWNGNVYCVDSDGFTYSNESNDCNFFL